MGSYIAAKRKCIYIIQGAIPIWLTLHKQHPRDNADWAHIWHLRDKVDWAHIAYTASKGQLWFGSHCIYSIKGTSLFGLTLHIQHPLYNTDCAHVRTEHPRDNADCDHVHTKHPRDNADCVHVHTEHPRDNVDLAHVAHRACTGRCRSGHVVDGVPNEQYRLNSRAHRASKGQCWLGSLACRTSKGQCRLGSRWIIIVRLSLLTLTHLNQMRKVLLFVCFKMADETNLISKLPVADRTRGPRKRALLVMPSARLRWFFFASYSPAPILMRPRHFARSCAISSHISVGTLKSLREALRVSLYRFFWPSWECFSTCSSPNRIFFDKRPPSILVTWPVHLSCANFRRVCTLCVPALFRTTVSRILSCHLSFTDSADYISFPLGALGPLWFIWKRSSAHVYVRGRNQCCKLHYCLWRVSIKPRLPFSKP